MHGYTISSYEPLADCFFPLFQYLTKNNKTKINNHKKQELSEDNAARRKGLIG